ncbi:MAG TPA: 3-hydroxyacyl-CoA dehydrogenase NAD-binding domain-containing protein, partial [Sphingomonas sp.]
MQTVGVIGAGQMGAGIAQVSAQAGFRVLLSDVGRERAEAGKAGIAKLLDRAVSKEKIMPQAR